MTKDDIATGAPRTAPTNVHSVETFQEIERLMKKLNVTPATALDMLLGMLADLDRQCDEHDEMAREAPPGWWLDARAVPEHAG